MEIDLPEVVAEVTAAFRRYETALNKNDIAVLNELFWNDPRTVRYGIGSGENFYGHAQIAGFRKARDPAGVVDRALLKVWVVTYGRDFAIADCEFQRHGSTAVGRQSQTWMRTPDGWRIVAAHVSFPSGKTPLRTN